MDNDEWDGFWIGQQPTLFLRICYECPIGIPSEGWHRFTCEAVAPGFAARFPFESQLLGLKEFEKQLRSMYDSMKGTAGFSSTEGNVEIEAQMDRLGHVTWNIVLQSADVGPKLAFSIEEDQMLLWNVAAKIDDMFEALATRKV